MRTGLGFLVLRNQAMMRDRLRAVRRPASPPARRPAVGGPFEFQNWRTGPERDRRHALRRRSALGALALFGFEVVVDAEPHAGRVVHLAGGLLGVLKLGEAVLHLRQLLLDQAIELLHLLPGHGERILVELSLLVAEAHRFLFLRIARPSGRLMTGSTDSLIGLDHSLK